MSGPLQNEVNLAGAKPASKPVLLTPDRWLAIYVIGAFVFLTVARHAFREFIPR